MKRFKQVLLLGLVFNLLYPAIASAEIIQGQVVAVSPDNQSVTISQLEPSNQAGRQITLRIKDDAQLRGVNSLQELQVGDEVYAEASRKFFFGAWEARSLEATGQAKGMMQRMKAKTEEMKENMKKSPSENIAQKQKEMAERQLKEAEKAQKNLAERQKELAEQQRKSAEKAERAAAEEVAAYTR